MAVLVFVSLWVDVLEKYKNPHQLPCLGPWSVTFWNCTAQVLNVIF